jgi:hypothetical protein
MIAVLGAAVCLLLTLWIWGLVATLQNTWPFPALYFIELVAFSLACATAYRMSDSSRQTVTWITVGVLAAFSILGAWTVGLHYLPVTGLFLTLALGDDLRHAGNLGLHAATGLLAALVQGTAMLLLTRLS